MAYNLFISHSWEYSDAYQKLCRLLDNRPYFEYKNYSVPFNDPIHTNGTDKQLIEAIINKIIPTSAVLILAGVYATYSRWINKEVEISKYLNKKIIAIEPWASEKTSTFVKENADEIVGWNTDSIVKAIRGF